MRFFRLGFCEELGCSYAWTSGQKPHLIIKNGKNFNCNAANCVPFVVFGFSTRFSTPSSLTSSTSSLQETERLPRKFQQEEVKVRANFHSGTRCVNQQKSNTTQTDNDEELQSDELQGVLDWLQEFKHGPVDKSVLEHRNTSSSSHELPLEPRAKVVSGKHNIFYSLPEGPEVFFYSHLVSTTTSDWLHQPQCQWLSFRLLFRCELSTRLDVSCLLVRHLTISFFW